MFGSRALVILLALLLPWSGCVAWDELTHGVAIWPFVLGTEVHTEDLATFRGTQVVVVVADVEGGELPDEFPVSGAAVEVGGPTGASAELGAAMDAELEREDAA